MKCPADIIEWLAHYWFAGIRKPGLSQMCGLLPWHYSWRPQTPDCLCQGDTDPDCPTPAESIKLSFCIFSDLLIYVFFLHTRLHDTIWNRVSHKSLDLQKWGIPACIFFSLKLNKSYIIPLLLITNSVRAVKELELLIGLKIFMVF